ncbi:MAG: ParA family protein [Chloroflexota bacterium]
MIISLSNHKGGVGKTTSATSIASAMAETTEQRILLIDTDPSGNSTLLTTGHTNYDRDQSLYAVITANRTDAPHILRDCIMPSNWYPNLHILPGNHHTQEAQRILSGTPGAPFRLAQTLRSISQQYAAVVIDTQPSFALLTEMALLSSDIVFIPTEPRYLETSGLTQILTSIQSIRHGWEHLKLQVGGILITKMDGRIRGHREMVHTLRQHPQLGKLIVGIIPVNEAVSYSHHAQKSIFQYDQHCSAAIAYSQFVQQLTRGRA